MDLVLCARCGAGPYDRDDGEGFHVEELEEACYENSLCLDCYNAYTELHDNFWARYAEELKRFLTEGGIRC